MPHENIHPRHHGASTHPAPYARVLWQRDRYVQVAVIRDAPSDPSLDAAEERGRQLASQCDDLIAQGVPPDELVVPAAPVAPPKPSLLQQLDVIGPPGVAGQVEELPDPIRDQIAELIVTVHDHAWSQGLFVDLDRDGCNVAIRALRRARDQAYGKDA